MRLLSYQDQRLANGRPDGLCSECGLEVTGYLEVLLCVRILHNSRAQELCVCVCVCVCVNLKGGGARDFVGLL